MKLYTDRLELLALNQKLFYMLLNNIEELENYLNCSYNAEPLDGFFRLILEHKLKLVIADPGNYTWNSLWLIIRKTDRIIVGTADFKSPPNDLYEAEIGYGLGKAFEHNGYMTEAVSAMCNWAKGHDNIYAVTAETEINNIASQRVLARVGFQQVTRADTIWWRLAF